MLEKDILLIINPNASKGRGRKSAKLIQSIFKSRGRQCTVAYTKGAGHAATLARKGVQYEYKVIIAAGGDGTVNEVLNGIMFSGRSSSVTMGIMQSLLMWEYAGVLTIQKECISSMEQASDSSPWSISRRWSIRK